MFFVRQAERRPDRKALATGDQMQPRITEQKGEEDGRAFRAPADRSVDARGDPVQRRQTLNFKEGQVQTAQAPLESDLRNGNFSYRVGLSAG